jgi:hypothetical protein
LVNKEVLEFRLFEMSVCLKCQTFWILVSFSLCTPPIKHFNEFLDPDNIAFDTTIIAVVWIIKDFSSFVHWNGGHLGFYYQLVLLQLNQPFQWIPWP